MSKLYKITLADDPSEKLARLLYRNTQQKKYDSLDARTKELELILNTTTKTIVKKECPICGPEHCAIKLVHPDGTTEYECPLILLTWVGRVSLFSQKWRDSNVTESTFVREYTPRRKKDAP